MGLCLDRSVSILLPNTRRPVRHWVRRGKHNLKNILQTPECRLIPGRMCFLVFQEQEHGRGREGFAWASGWECHPARAKASGMGGALWHGGVCVVVLLMMIASVLALPSCTTASSILISVSWTPHKQYGAMAVILSLIIPAMQTNLPLSLLSFSSSHCFFLLLYQSYQSTLFLPLCFSLQMQAVEVDETKVKLFFFLNKKQTCFICVHTKECGACCLKPLIWCLLRSTSREIIEILGAHIKLWHCTSTGHLRFFFSFFLFKCSIVIRVCFNAC